MIVAEPQFEDFAHAARDAYDLDPSAELTLLNVSENGTFRVDDPVQGRSVLRVHRTGYHAREAIASELAWITALRSEGTVRTPAFIPSPAGDDVVLVRLAGGEERFVVRFEWVDGVEPTEDRLAADFEELGGITARLHAHARTWRRPEGFTRFVWDFDTSLGEHGHWGRWQDGLAVGPQEQEVLGRCADLIRRRLAVYGTGPERFGLVHADMRLANLLVKGNDVTVIDFDDCGLSWFMYDLGSSLSFIEHEPYVPELVDAWVRGYRAVAPLTAQDEAELPTFIMLRRLLLVAWIGSHSSTETAQAMGEDYTATSCRLAEHYLGTMAI
ncbi:MAG: phosphotransferase [Actinobacteria bacterium]|nr:phosphotransferase [Actinomycetota bacterium]